MGYENYVVVSVKMPAELKDVIDVKARKAGITRNGWIVGGLAREARWGTGKRGVGKKK